MLRVPHFKSPDGQERGSDLPMTLTKEQIEKFRKNLEDKRAQLLKNAEETLNDEMQFDPNDLPDEMDQASTEYLQSFQFRLRGRDKAFLDKIDRAIAKIGSGEFGICEECGEEISLKRLEARPETSLCIKCKEDQEQHERGVSKS